MAAQSGEDANLPAPPEPKPKPSRPGILGKWSAVWRVPKAAPIPDGDRKLAAIARLDADLKATSADVARLVLAETKDQAEKKRAAHRIIETKATSIIGFATVVLGFTATFNLSLLLRWHWGWFPAVAPAIALEFIAIIAGVFALQAQTYSLPDALIFNHPDALEDPLNEARIAMALSQRWAIYERALDAGNATRSARLGVALWSFVSGVFYAIILALVYMFVSQPALQTSVPVVSKDIAAPRVHSIKVPSPNTKLPHPVATAHRGS